MAARALPSAGEPSSASQDVHELLPDLPGPTVACILQHVPLRQRLNCCALVCCSWAAAAAAAPADADIYLDSRESREQLQDWLAKHAGVVVGLSARGAGAWDMRQVGLQLPVPKLTQLRRLKLYRIFASSGSSSASNGSSSAAVTLPQLQELKLVDCWLTVPQLSQLLSGTTLTKLHWEYRQTKLYSGDTISEQLTDGQAYAFLWQRLQLLPQLAELKLTKGCLAAADIAPLSNMQHLQRLDLTVTDSWPIRDDSGPSKLLSALQHLTQLQHLSLHHMKLHRVSAQSQQQGSSYHCFSAVTASTQLTALHLEEWVSMPVPQAAFQHMFPPGRILPHVKVLSLDGCPGQPCVEAAQLAMIAASCSALQELTLRDVTPEGFDTSCLAQLPSGVTRVEGLEWTRPA